MALPVASDITQSQSTPTRIDVLWKFTGIKSKNN